VAPVAADEGQLLLAKLTTGGLPQVVPDETQLPAAAHTPAEHEAEGAGEPAVYPPLHVYAVQMLPEAMLLHVFVECEITGALAPVQELGLQLPAAVHMPSKHDADGAGEPAVKPLRQEYDVQLPPDAVLLQESEELAIAGALAPVQGAGVHDPTAVHSPAEHVAEGAGVPAVYPPLQV
jgi:hypothetical protein